MNLFKRYYYLPISMISMIVGFKNDELRSYIIGAISAFALYAFFDYIFVYRRRG